MNTKRLNKKVKLLISEGYPPKQATAIAHKMLQRKKTTAWDRQQKRRKGSVVNTFMPRPTAECEPVDSEMCAICGEFYNEVVLHAGGIREASERIRSVAGGWAKGGGYRSRGPLLWAMHVLKLEAWYERHRIHCQLALEYEAEQLPVPFPPSVVWAESFGDTKLQKLADQWFTLYEIELKKDWENSPVIQPLDYTKQMKRLLLAIQQLVDIAEPNRKKLNLPSRQVGFNAWKSENFALEYGELIPF